MGATCLYGYQRIKGSQYDFDIHAEEAQVVEQVFKSHSQGNGYLKIKQITGCPLQSGYCQYAQ